MPNILFEAHLAQTMPGLKGSDTALLDEETADLTEALKLFASGIDDDADVGEAFDCFCEYFELENSEAEYFKEALGQVTEDIFGVATDENVRSFLAILNQPFPKPNQTSPNKSGMTAAELGIRKFLRSLTVQAHVDPYMNTWGKDVVKVFDRRAARYGHGNIEFNQQPNKPLKNPTLNVALENEVFQLVDSIGIGAKTHWRVVNSLTNEYVTRQLPKEIAEHIAAELNDEFIAEVEQLEQQELQESYPTRKHFQQVASTVRAIEHPGVRQELADHHANIFAQQNPRFDHSKFHAACGTKTPRERGIKESNTLPPTAIQENILQPINQDRMNQYLAAFDKSNFTMGGSVSQSSYSTSPLADLKAAAKLIQERKEKFGEDDGVTESNAIKAVSERNLRKKK